MPVSFIRDSITNFSSVIFPSTSQISCLSPVPKRLVFIVFENDPHLQDDIDQDGDEGVGEVEYEPDLDWFDLHRDGETRGDRQVDGGQDHHAGDVDGVDYAELVVTAYHLDVVGG